MIYRNEQDYAVFVATLANATRFAGWRCLAYCLMPNHYHLVLQTPRPSLSEGMHRLNGAYAAWFNGAHNRTGHVFEGRFRAALIRSEAHLLAALRYVAQNPVRASLTQHPQHWRWSSYRMTAGYKPSPGWLATAQVLTLFNESAPEYREFVLTREASDARPALEEILRSRSGNDLHRARDLGYSQAELAAHLGVSQPTISRIMRKRP